MKKPYGFKKFLVTLLLVCFCGAETVAQGVNEQSSSALSGPRKQLATIIFAGLGGAILGLSTLSFYGRPQDHLENIALGFGIGVISGTAFVTWKAIARPIDFYGTEPVVDPQAHSRARRDHYVLSQNGRVIQPINFNWTF